MKQQHNLTLNDAGEMSYDNATDKGFYEDFHRVRDLVAKFGQPGDLTFLMQIWLNHRLMLVVTELAEGTEAIRNSNYSHEPKSGGLGEEIADAQIRLADLYHHTQDVIGIDNESAIINKMLYNQSRPRKHGKTL